MMKEKQVSLATREDNSLEDTGIARIQGTLIHELDYIFDRICGKDGKPYTRLNRAEFRKKYILPERGNISAYDQTRAIGYWAEFFMYKYSNEPNVRYIQDNPNKFPETKGLFDHFLKEEGFS